MSLEREENGVEHWDVYYIFSFNFNMLDDIPEEGELGSVNPRQFTHHRHGHPAPRTGGAGPGSRPLPGHPLLAPTAPPELL